MAGKASELCLPWLGPRPSINKQAAPPPAWPQLAWPRDPTPRRPGASHSSPAQPAPAPPDWTEDPNTHMPVTLKPDLAPQELPIGAPSPWQMASVSTQDVWRWAGDRTETLVSTSPI